MKYTVVLEPQDEGGFTVQCVEIPGAISQGETREEALANIKEAIELVLEVQREELHKRFSSTSPRNLQGRSSGCRINSRSSPGKTWSSTLRSTGSR